MGLSEKGGVKERKKGKQARNLVAGARRIPRKEEKMSAGGGVVVPLG